MLDRQDAAVQKPSTSEPWTGLQLLVSEVGCDRVCGVFCGGMVLL